TSFGLRPHFGRSSLQTCDESPSATGAARLSSRLSRRETSFGLRPHFGLSSLQIFTGPFGRAMHVSTNVFCCAAESAEPADWSGGVPSQRALHVSHEPALQLDGSSIPASSPAARMFEFLWTASTTPSFTNSTR